MPRTLVINSSNYLAGSGNRFIYRFPNTVKFDVGSAIAVANISMYNSIQNITIKRGNNVLTFNFLGVDYTFNIPEGYYSISDLNFYLQQQCIIRGLYMTANKGADNVYFIELVVNSIRYATSLNFYVIPTESEATAKGYVKPTNATWAFPTVAETPRLTFGQQPHRFHFWHISFSKPTTNQYPDFINRDTCHISHRFPYPNVQFSQ
jgi:hypothetical protein